MFPSGLPLLNSSAIWYFPGHLAVFCKDSYLPPFPEHLKDLEEQLDGKEIYHSGLAPSEGKFQAGNRAFKYIL